jgi:hypothetical protein
MFLSLGALITMDISTLINDLLPMAIIAIVGMLWRIDNRLQALEFGLKETDRRLSDSIHQTQVVLGQVSGFLQKNAGFWSRRSARNVPRNDPGSPPLVPWDEEGD